MKTEKILEEFGEVINYFIEHKANEENSEFYENVNKLINIKAALHKANGDEKSESTCNLQSVSFSEERAEVRRCDTCYWEMKGKKVCKTCNELWSNWKRRT